MYDNAPKLAKPKQAMEISNTASNQKSTIASGEHGGNTNNVVALSHDKKNDGTRSYPPEIILCTDCGENTPESGFVCDECKLNALND